MKKIFVLFFLLAILLVPMATLADEYGLDATAGAAKLDKGGDLPSFAGKVIGAALSLIGVAFFALMVYGGFLWMTAHGKEEQAKKALDTVISAVLGIVIIIGAYALTSFLFKSVGGG